MRRSAGYLAAASLAALAACSEARAEDLGTVGPVYEVAEPDLLATLEQRAREAMESGRWEALMARTRERARAYVRRPPGRKLARAARGRSWLLDPTIEVPYDVRDAEGRLLFPAGTRVNPLDHIRLSSRLVFLDGDDPEQVAWAERLLAEPHLTKPVLVSGSPTALMERWGRPVYFDQHGWLVSQFQIEALPAVVRQEGRALRIEEIALP